MLHTDMMIIEGLKDPVRMLTLPFHLAHGNNAVAHPWLLPEVTS